jgi:hypothetical protein
MRRRPLRKLYRALTSSPPPALGTRLQHHLVVGSRRPGLPFHTLASDTPYPGSLPCELDVLSSSKVALTGRAAERWGPEAYEVTLDLLTGRTHQIRAQLSAEGCPLLGDDLYGRLTDPGLRQQLLKGDSSPPAVNAAGERLLEEPKDAVGLQSWRLEVAAGGPFGEEAVEFDAGDPWWRRRER